MATSAGTATAVISTAVIVISTSDTTAASATVPMALAGLGTAGSQLTSESAPAAFTAELDTGPSTVSRDFRGTIQIFPTTEIEDLYTGVRAISLPLDGVGTVGPVDRVTPEARVGLETAWDQVGIAEVAGVADGDRPAVSP